VGAHGERAIDGEATVLVDGAALAGIDRLEVPFVFSGAELSPRHEGRCVPEHVAVTDALLKVTPFMFVVSTGTITLMTFALCSLAIGFGTFFPQFETENAAQIPTSFGGLLYMMSSVSLIAVVIIIEAIPVYAYVSRRPDAHQSPAQMAVFFGLSAGLCLGCTVIPLRLAQFRLERTER
jgi:ABC-2 type transport system permease protein